MAKTNEITFEDNIVDVPIADIELDPKYYNNPRTSLDDEKIRELADSFKVVGIIHPITLLRHVPGKYILVTGFRRYTAAKLIDWKFIPSRIIRNATEQQVKELQLIENCQRQDIHPIEEARAFKDFGQPEDIASSIGKSLQYVYDRLHLLRLHDTPADLFFKGILSISHALLLCRLNHPDQLMILEDFLITTGRGKDKQILGTNSIQKLKYLISRKASVSLSEAIFDTSDRKLNKEKGACTKCVERSGFNRTLFNDITADDICFNTACFNIKSAVQCLTIEADLKTQGYEVIRLTGMYDESPVAQSYELKVDYTFDLAPVDFSHESKIIGLYFEHPARSKVGQVVKIIPKAEIVIEEAIAKKKKKSAIEEIKEAKAITAFKNAMTGKIGQRIGEFECDYIPLPGMKLIGFWLLESMSKDLKNDVFRFYKWEVKPKLTDTYRKNTEHYTMEQIIQFVLVVILYDTVKTSDPGKLQYGYILQLATLWKVDILAIATEIEKEFEVKLDIFKTLFHE